MSPARGGWLLVLAAAAHAGSLEARVGTPAGKPVEDAAVVLEPVSGALPPAHATAVIEQKDREFRPYLSIVQTGTAIDFPNRDPIMHHVYSFSKPKVFEIKLYAGKPVAPVEFDRPGEVVLGCNIHDWMEAHVLVVETPYYAKSGTDGRAQIAAVPAGRYRLRLWHPRQRAAVPAREVEIGAAPLRLALTVNVAPRVVKPKPPMDAETY